MIDTMALEMIMLREVAAKYEALLDSIEARTMALRREVGVLTAAPVHSAGVERRLAIIEAQLEMIVDILTH